MHSRNVKGVKMQLEQGGKLLGLVISSFRTNSPQQRCKGY